VRITIDVEKDLLQHITWIYVAPIAPKPGSDLNQEVRPVELVEQAKHTPSLFMPKALHQTGRDRVSNRLGSPLGFIDDPLDALLFSWLKLTRQLLDAFEQ
jgi:hypothetical protein